MYENAGAAGVLLCQLRAEGHDESNRFTERKRDAGGSPAIHLGA